MRDSRFLATRGFTLMEVIASVVILTMFLIMVLVAQSRHVRQIKKASQIETAVKLTDQLMADWFDDESPIAVSQSGRFGQNGQYWWQTTQVPTQLTAPNWKVVTIRLDTYIESQKEPLLSIEFLSRPEQTRTNP